MDYDTVKVPLGKLTKAQIKAGYEALKNIENVIKARSQDSTASTACLVNACNVFYTRIPHNFG